MMNIIIYNERLFLYNLELKHAQQSIFFEIISKNKNNAHTLFNIVDRLTNPSASIPPELLPDKPCNDFVFLSLWYFESVHYLRPTTCFFL